MRALLAEYDNEDSSSDDDEADSGSTAAGSATDTVTAAVQSSQTRKRAISASAAACHLVEQTNASKKSRLLPPPPLHLQSNFCTPSAASATPTSASTSAATSTSHSPHTARLSTVSQSDGRIRAFPHVDGNWATHVYIAIPASQALNTLTDECDSLLPVHLPCHRLPPSELHLSLSRCVTLRHHQIQHFNHLLSSALSTLQLPSTPLPVMLHSLALYCNEQRTRSFAALRVGAGELELLSVLAAVDGVMSEMGLPTFYEQPELHVTYAWRLGDVWKERAERDGEIEQASRQSSCERKQVTELVADVDETTSEGSSVRDTSFDRPTVASCLVEVSAVHCKVGNRLTVIPLKAKR